VDQILGRVLDHMDFLKDNLSFSFDLFFGQCGMKKNVGKQFHDQGQMRMERSAVETHEFFARECVQRAPHGFYFP
jgi:hypothetical protein